MARLSNILASDLREFLFKSISAFSIYLSRIATVPSDSKTSIEWSLISTSSSQIGDQQQINIDDLPTDAGLSVQKEEEPSPDEFIVTDQDYNEVVSRVLPDLQRRVEYPEMARRAGVEGRVSIKVLIGKDGRPKQGRTIVEETASELLNPAAVKAIMAQVFPPATQNGQPVEVWVVIPIVFRLRWLFNYILGAVYFNSLMRV